MSRIIPVAALGALAALALAGCGNGDRKATADTGTAKATIKTDAPKNAVSDSMLQQEAVQAATAASTPVNGTNMTSITPASNTTH